MVFTERLQGLIEAFFTQTHDIAGRIEEILDSILDDSLLTVCDMLMYWKGYKVSRRRTWVIVFKSGLHG